MDDSPCLLFTATMDSSINHKSEVIMYMHVITATMCRNIGSDPMPDARWQQAQADLYADMSDALNVPADAAWDVHNGIVIWQGESEPSHKLSVILKHAADPDALDDLRRRLSELARHYEQECIALTVGVSELC